MAAAKQEMTPSRSRQHSAKKASLYVGDLHPDVTEEELIEKFSSTVPVVSAHLCRCSSTGKSLCYAYLNFDSYSGASNALACLNHTDLKGNPMRIMWFQKDQTQRRSGFGNLFIKNLESSITSGCLERIFSPFGSILSCKVVEEKGHSKGFGFVQLDSEQSATAARCALNGSLIDGKKLYVAKFVNKTERAALSGTHDFTNLYVKNLAEDVTEDLLLKTFAPYGRISSVVIMRDDTGKSKGFGFVSFFKQEDAKKATDALNGAVLGSMKLFVGRAQTKAERTEMLKEKFKESFSSDSKKFKRLNLYVKCLSESIDETRLREIFGRYGTIVSAKVKRHENGVSKGFGFVCFSNCEESKQAQRELNGFVVDGKSLVVRIAEQRDFRKSSGQVPNGFDFPHLPVRLPTQSFVPYIQPYHITSYLPVGQAELKENQNSHDKLNKRIVVCNTTPSAYASVKGKISGLKHGFSGEGNRCKDAKTLEAATSVLKAALLKSPVVAVNAKANN